MKKVASVSASFGYFLLATLAFAAPGDIVINPPHSGYDDLGKFITAVINLVFIVGAVSVLIMLVWGAVQWIFSGGEKEAVSHARNRIIHALVGLAILAVAFALAVFFGRFVGINLFQLTPPTPSNPNPTQAPPP